MGEIIIIIAVLLEAALAAYCIKTKDNHTKARSWLRISAFAAFIVFTLVSIVAWSFRWYFLCALLLIWAAIGGVRLFTNKLGNKPYKTGRVILKAIAMLLLVILATVPALVFPQYEIPAQTGGYKIATATYTYTDTNRIETFSDTGEYRKVTVEFWYPKNTDGTYPLIVFSHGAFGVKMSNTSTYMELASNGYIVCAIDHPYHAAGTIDTDGNFTRGSSEFMTEVADANRGVYSDGKLLELYKKWLDVRTGDINFVLDTIIESTDTGSEDILALVDTDKIGLIGHSLGGAASAQLGRDRTDIGAVVNLDGTMLGEYRGIANGQPVLNDEPYPLPLLSFYSEYVMDAIEAEPDYVSPNQYISLISPEAFEICIKGSNHMSYTDLPLFSPLLANVLSGVSGVNAQATVDETYCIETMNELVLNFFNCYLKGNGVFAVED